MNGWVLDVKHPPLHAVHCGLSDIIGGQNNVSMSRCTAPTEDWKPVHFFLPQYLRIVTKVDEELNIWKADLHVSQNGQAR